MNSCALVLFFIIAPYKYSYLLTYLLTYLLVSFLLININGSSVEKHVRTKIFTRRTFILYLFSRFYISLIALIFRTLIVLLQHVMNFAVAGLYAVSSRSPH